MKQSVPKVETNCFVCWNKRSYLDTLISSGLSAGTVALDGRKKDKPKEEELSADGPYVIYEPDGRTLFMSKKERKALSPLTAFLYGSGSVWYRGLVRTDAKYHPLAQDSLQMMMKRYHAEHIIVGHTIFKDISAFYGGKVIGVNVDNEENRKKKRGRALLIDRNTYFVVGDKGKMRKLF